MSGFPPLRGRPAATSHAEIERAAFELFAMQGFEATTLDAIADRVGVARRTVTRYYASKNDIPWGRFDLTLDDFRELLRTAPAELPLWRRVHHAVVALNDFSDDAQPSHRERMRLILSTPALQAHSVLRYRQWRAAVADHVAAETGQQPDDPLPRLVGHVSLALAVSAYERWLDAAPGHDDRRALLIFLDEAMTSLRDYLA